jgi:hypothetical protein
MSAFNLATVAIFASLGLVALALGLLARAYTTTALVTGLVGLLTLTTTSTWLAQAGPVIVNDPSTTNCSRWSLLRRYRPSCQMNGVSPAVLRQLAQLRAATRRQPQQPPPQDKCAKPEAPVSGPPLSCPPAPQQSVDHDAIGRRLDNQFYSSRRLEQRELVTGLEGSWYIIDLKVNGGKLGFPDRRFKLPTDTAAAVQDSASKLQSDIFDHLPRIAPEYRLFVRGRADERQVSRGPTDPPDNRWLKVRPTEVQTGPDRERKYTREQVTRQPAPAAVANSHLPNLRADSVLEAIKGKLKGHGNDIEILDNLPAPGDAKTVELVLFVKW